MSATSSSELDTCHARDTFPMQQLPTAQLPSSMHGRELSIRQLSHLDNPLADADCNEIELY